MHFVGKSSLSKRPLVHIDIYTRIKYVSVIRGRIHRDDKDMPGKVIAIIRLNIIIIIKMSMTQILSLWRYTHLDANTHFTSHQSNQCQCPALIIRQHSDTFLPYRSSLLTRKHYATSNSCSPHSYTTIPLDSNNYVQQR